MFPKQEKNTEPHIKRGNEQELSTRDRVEGGLNRD